MGFLDRFRSQPQPSTAPRGGSGRGHYGGYLELEELNRDLAGLAGLRAFDKMYRTDPDCRRSLSMVCNPISGATWVLEPHGGDEATALDEQIADSIRWALFEFLKPALPMHFGEALPIVTRSGFAPFEHVWDTADHDGRQLLLPRRLEVRLPRSVQRWFQEDGQLTGIEQFLPLAGGMVKLDAPNLVYYRVGAEGDNWEGTSLLRPAYKPWYIKDKLERLDAIGAEREATGIPVVYPPRQATDEQLDGVEEALANLKAGEEAFVVMPGPHAQDLGDEASQGWRLEVLGLGSEGSRDLSKSIEMHRDAIAAAVVAEFMRLGQSGVGARATADVQQDPFYAGVEAIAGQIEAPWNDELIPRMVALNFPDADGFPKLKMEQADSTSLAELATFASGLITSGVLTPDYELEDYMRERAGFPPADPEVRAQREAEREEKKALELEAQKQAVAAGGQPDPGGKPGKPGKPGQNGNGKPVTMDQIFSDELIFEATHTGAMVALYPPPDVAAKLALKGGEPADELHVTLAFLGDADEIVDPERLRHVVASWAEQTPPLTGEISGVGLFTAGPTPVTYLSVDLPALPAARQRLVEMLDDAGIPASRKHSFTPHVTLAYADRAADAAKIVGTKLTLNA